MGAALRRPRRESPTEHTSTLADDDFRITFLDPATEMFGGGAPSRKTKQMIKELGEDGITAMVTAFYELVFKDKRLDPFIVDHSQPQFLAPWIIEQMTGEPRWSSQRPPYARQMAHGEAWHSHRRPAKDRGKHFDVIDCRAWMRLHFLACRETGLFEQCEAFEQWYPKFIGSFIGIYDHRAPQFAQADADWSLVPSKVAAYRKARTFPDLHAQHKR